MTSTEKDAALSLLERAKGCKQQSTAELLILAASRLDSTLDTVSQLNQWLETWLDQNKDRTVPNG